MTEPRDIRSKVIKDAEEAAKAGQAAVPSDEHADLGTSIASVTRILGQYRDGLLAQGFSRTETLQMILVVQNTILGIGQRKS